MATHVPMLGPFSGNINYKIINNSVQLRLCTLERRLANKKQCSKNDLFRILF